MELALIRVQLCVIQHFDQHERTEPDPERQPMEFEPATLEMDGRRWILSKEDHLGELELYKPSLPVCLCLSASSSRSLPLSFCALL